ncbi:hypothetical protein [Staphylococcus durrellii]|nr:hypothetical protein [Staphylococcus durrellii]
MQVEVITHNPRWKDEFEKEAQKIKAILYMMIYYWKYITSAVLP